MSHKEKKREADNMFVKTEKKTFNAHEHSF